MPGMDIGNAYAAADVLTQMNRAGLAEDGNVDAALSAARAAREAAGRLEGAGDGPSLCPLLDALDAVGRAASVLSGAWGRGMEQALAFADAGAREDIGAACRAFEEACAEAAGMAPYAARLAEEMAEGGSGAEADAVMGAAGALAAMPSGGIAPDALTLGIGGA